MTLDTNNQKRYAIIRKSGDEGRNWIDLSQTFASVEVAQFQITHTDNERHFKAIGIAYIEVKVLETIYNK